MIERAFSPFACRTSVLGCAQADMERALALSNARFHYDLSAEGAALYQPGAQPRTEAMEQIRLKPALSSSFETGSRTRFAARQ